MICTFYILPSEFSFSMFHVLQVLHSMDHAVLVILEMVLTSRWNMVIPVMNSGFNMLWFHWHEMHASTDLGRGLFGLPHKVWHKICPLKYIKTKNGFTCLRQSDIQWHHTTNVHQFQMWYWIYLGIMSIWESYSLHPNSYKCTQTIKDLTKYRDQKNYRVSPKNRA